MNAHNIFVLQAGSELRSGVTSVTVTDTHYDGGFSSTGLFNYLCSSHFRVDAGPDEPDLTFEFVFRRCSWVDHAAWWTDMTITDGAIPVMPDNQIRLNSHYDTVSVVDSVAALGPPHGWDSYYGGLSMPQGSNLVERSRFERSGNPEPTAVGSAGFLVNPPPGGTTVPRFEFVSSEWHNNAAGFGAAVGVAFGSFDVQFRRCLFRCVFSIPGLSRR
eukprot:COSAG04_NODE_3793_length_2526_cov_1.479604_4_plen_216_part_00